MSEPATVRVVVHFESRWTETITVVLPPGTTTDTLDDVVCKAVDAAGVSSE